MLAPDDALVDVVVEIPRGSRNKYEYDPALGRMRLDRVLYSSIHYPTDYGYIPGTLTPDGDPLDALVIVEEPTFPSCIVAVRPVGLLEMKDEKGLDSKILGVPHGDPRFASVRDLKDLPEHWLLEIENFFRTYKQLEDIETEIIGWRDARRAWEVIEASRLSA